MAVWFGKDTLDIALSLSWSLTSPSSSSSSSVGHENMLSDEAHCDGDESGGED